eukprot:776001-Karenia_brevis.AAC.1
MPSLRETEAMTLMETGGDTHGNVSAVAGKIVNIEVEIGFVEQMTHAHIGAGHRAVETDTIITYLSSDGGQRSVIVKEFDSLTVDELRSHAKEVAAGKLGELKDLYDLGCYGRMPRNRARNIVDVRW